MLQKMFVCAYLHLYMHHRLMYECSKDGDDGDTIE